MSTTDKLFALCHSQMGALSLITMLLASLLALSAFVIYECLAESSFFIIHKEKGWLGMQKSHQLWREESRRSNALGTHFRQVATVCHLLLWRRKYFYDAHAKSREKELHCCCTKFHFHLFFQITFVSSEQLKLWTFLWNEIFVEEEDAKRRLLQKSMQHSSNIRISRRL